MLPLIVRRSKLGNIIDVRTGPLGDRWLAYIRTTIAKAGWCRPIPIWKALDPFPTRWASAAAAGATGSTFSPPSPPIPRFRRRSASARDPHITLMDLGGVASFGNDRSMLTDQFAHHQRIADLFNDAHGFPRPSVSGEEVQPRFRSAEYPPPGGGAPPKPKRQRKPRAPKPVAAEAEDAPTEAGTAPPEGAASLEATAATEAAEAKPAKPDTSQGKRVFDPEEARRARLGLEDAEQRAHEAEARAKVDETRRAGGDVEVAQFQGQRPRPTKEALDIIADVNRENPVKADRNNAPQMMKELRDRIGALRESLDDPTCRKQPDVTLNGWSRSGMPRSKVRRPARNHHQGRRFPRPSRRPA